MSAAASAHQHGAKVILLEKLAFVGGSSALSGGALAAGESNPQKRAGTKDVSNEGFVNIWLKDQDRSFPGGDESMPKLDRMQKLAKEFNTTVNWMESDIGHKFAVPRPFGYGGPNYAHAPAEAPIPASGIGSAHAGGRFVIKAFKAYLDQAGVPIMTGTRAEELITDNKGNVVGVRATKGKQKIEIRAKAVVLGTGGFARNKELLQKFVPSYAPYTDVSNATPGATGDGIIMAQKIGAAGFKDGWVMGISPVSYKRELNNTLRTKNVFKEDVFVNLDGKRFVKEDLPYIVDPIAAQKAAWAILDSKDPAFNKMPEFLVPFDKAPFYAVRVVPSTMGTIGGLQTNDKFQVLRADGSVIKGLYAGGETANRPFYRRVYTSGTGLGLAYTSGRIAGANAAQEK